MPKTKISEFSATPGNNTDIDGINIAEGCPPSGINDAIRELMAQLKDFQAGTAGDSFNGPIGATTPAAGTFTNLSASGTFALTGDQVQISEGGTGQTTANAAFNALAPSQTSQAGKYLKTDGTNTSWDALDISTADITGTLPIANGGTGLTALGTGVQTALGQNVTGSGGIVLASSPSLTTPNLGTPSAVTLTNATGLPLSTGVTGTLATTNGGTGLTSFTANGVVYASSSSALTTGSALTFDGTSLSVAIVKRDVDNSFVTLLGGTSSATSAAVYATGPSYSAVSTIYIDSAETVFRSLNGVSSRMTLTSTGLGIGTSSWSTSKLYVLGNTTNYAITSEAPNGYAALNLKQTSGNTMSLGMASNGLFIYDNNAGTTRLTLDSSGNLGLGVTPSAWGTTKALEFSYGSFSANSSVGTDVAGNCYYNGTNWIYRATGVALRYNQATAGHSWHVASGTAGNAISFTQAMTLDASGNLGIGITSPSARLQLSATSSDMASAFGNIAVFSSDSQAADKGGSIGFGGVYTGTSIAQWSGVKGGKENSTDGNYAGYLSFFTRANGGSTTERARIDSSGNLLVGTTSGTDVARVLSAGVANSYPAFRAETSATTSQQQISFVNPNGIVGTITTDGSATAYNTSSDYRLKDNQQPLTGSGAFIDALKPKTWNWTADGSKGVGFIAHEVQEVSPGSVVGTKDAVDEEGKPVYQAMEYGSAEFIANIIAELQSLRARVAQLEGASA